jgi:7,8-dihydropterin-6-yl-methyl-4-(beta-D-ribofuranosyl)aminobenzene 5'-phosphate synthase
MRKLWMLLVLLVSVSCVGAAPEFLTSTTVARSETATLVEATSTPVVEAVQKEAEHVMTEETTNRLSVTIVYDNNAYAPGLKTSWGFSAWVEFNNRCVLFDTGGDGGILLENMRELGLNPERIDAVVLSHAHGDHTGGLEALLRSGVKPRVYLPPSFSETFKAHVARFTEVVEVSSGQEISEGVFTTGEVQANVPEQALVVVTERGLVIMTGCAHPGVVRMVECASALFERPVHLVLGGFHLSDRSREQVVDIVESFRALNVESVAPCHCTGDRAMQVFREMYGEDCYEAGVGRVIVIGD